MLNSKFAGILRTLTKSELKEFRDFVLSPVYNSNKNVIKLFDISRKFAPAFDNPALKKENLFKKLYPGKKNNDTVMRILLSDLLKLGEEFLIFKRAKTGAVGESLLLLEELKERKLDNLYNIHLKDIHKQLENVDDLRNKYFYKFELEIINVDYHVRKDKQHLICGNVLERAENLIYFTIIELVKNIHDLIINERTYNAKFEFNLPFEILKSMDVEALMEKIQKYRPVQFSILSLYYNLLMALIDEENEEKFDNLKKSIYSVYEKIPLAERIALFNDLETCCLNRMKYNTGKYRKEIFEVYNLMLKSGIFLPNGKNFMSAQKFKNILLAAVNLNEIEWAENFTSEYINIVQDEYRESMRYYSAAIISFMKKDYGPALENINKVRNDYLILKLDVKSWMLKIYYELNYTDSAYSLIDSYRHFISKNKSLSEYSRERHNNYLKFTSELLKLRSGSVNGSADRLAVLLKNTGNVVHKDWLIEKIKNLK
jgi:hypothetical protein